MKPLTLTMFSLAAVLGAAACTTTVYEPAPPPAAPALEPAPPPPPGVTGEVSFFYDSLAPYGSWVAVAGYGEVWVPHVAAWWRPYTEGRWAYTDEGWTWVGTESWGWAAYHYGRWYWDAEYGWAWVPGTVWAPAWVAWRSGGGQIGWAPLPPSVRWQAGIGFAGGGDFEAVIAPQHWCFVDERYIAAPAVREYIAPPARNVTYVRVTNNITNYTVVNNRIVNNSVDVARVEQVTGRPVERYRIVDRDSAEALHAQGARTDEIPMVRRLGPHVAGTPSAIESERRPTGGTFQPGQGRVIGAQGSATTSAPNPRATTTTRVETVEEVRQRHALETQQLQTHYDAERARLRQIHQTDQSQPPANLTAEQLKARQLAEQQALDAQHRNEADLLARRHRRELGAATAPKAKPTPTPKPKRHRDGDNSQH